MKLKKIKEICRIKIKENEKIDDWILTISDSV